MDSTPFNVPRSLVLIAGKGAYPRLLAESARAQGVNELHIIAFRGETDPRLHALADHWQTLPIGKLAAFLQALKETGCRDAVMAGQISPSHLFRLHPDKALRELLKTIHIRNAHTLFGAVADEMDKIGIQLRPAYLFMENTMPEAGTLGAIEPTEQQQIDIKLGLEVARATSDLDIGQTVVIKEGTVLAVEAFEGTDRSIRRAGGMGGAGCTVVKVAKTGHDMRFDIPVIGMRTFKSMRRVHAAALAVEAGRTILLERERLVCEADRLGISFTAFNLNREGENGYGQSSN